MDSLVEKEESLREYAAIGDLEGVDYLINIGVNVDSQNAVNGWTALHWAAKRNQEKVIHLLLEHGASKNIYNFNRQLPKDVSPSGDISELLYTSADVQSLDSHDISTIKINTSLPIIPNYIKNPEFIYNKQMKKITQLPDTSIQYDQNLLVIKGRVANLKDLDFIEIELIKYNLDLKKLILNICQELKIDEVIQHKSDINIDDMDLGKYIIRVRKLPNTIVRNDKDVSRITSNQEVELVLHKDFLYTYENYISSKHNNPFNYLSDHILNPLKKHLSHRNCFQTTKNTKFAHVTKNHSLVPDTSQSAFNSYLTTSLNEEDHNNDGDLFHQRDSVTDITLCHENGQHQKSKEELWDKDHIREDHQKTKKYKAHWY